MKSDKKHSKFQGDQPGKSVKRSENFGISDDEISPYQVGDEETSTLTEFLSAESLYLESRLALYWDNQDSYWLGTGAVNDFTGTSGNDVAYALDAPDVLHGGAGNDMLVGGNQDDTLYGGSGSDALLGEEGDDTLWGGSGSDILVGGSGSDVIDGGEGNDTAIFSGLLSSYDISVDGTSVIVSSVTDDNDQDQISNVEYLQFGDQTISVEQFLAGASLEEASVISEESYDLTAETPILETPDQLTFSTQSSVSLNVTAGLTDTDGSETLKIYVSGLPEGASLNAGTQGADGVWVLEPGELSGLMINFSTTIAVTTFALTITAVSTEWASGDTNELSSEVLFAMSENSSNTEEVSIENSNGTTIWVGAGYAYTDLQAAIDASQPGDTIMIASGSYDIGEVKITHDVRIIGDGEVTLTSAERVYKGLLVTTAGVDLYVENITFEGATSWDRNGAGIRHQGSNLIVVNCDFIGNENGILATADGTGDVTILGSSFIDNGFGDGYSHGIYIKGVNTLLVEDSKFIGTNVGHHIKSLATVSTTINNNFFDSADSQTSYSIQANSGGDLIVSNNIIIQGSDSDSPAIISYGVGRGGTPGSIEIYGNTVTNGHSTAILFRNYSDAVAEIFENEITNIDAGNLKLASGLAITTSNLMDGTSPSDVLLETDAQLGSELDENLNGTTGDDKIMGFGGSDTIYGGPSGSSYGGNDQIFGGDGDDKIFGGDGYDILLGESGHDYLDGGKAVDIISGGAGNDVLVGGAGADILLGRSGNDIFLSGKGGATINAGDGIDVIVMTGAYSEYRVWVEGGRTFVKSLVATDDSGKASIAEGEFVQFSDGVFVISTQTFLVGVVILSAEEILANQVANIDVSEYSDLEASTVSTNEPVYEAGQVSNAQPSILDDFRLSNISQVLSNDLPSNTIDGTSGDNFLVGADLNDLIDGKGGTDIMSGGGGNDTYIVEQIGDQVVESPNSGFDTIVSSTWYYNLPENVEKLVLTGDLNNDGYGNELDNVIIGNGNDNKLVGGAGNDVIAGNGGDDVLKGGIGSDAFIFTSSDHGNNTILDFELGIDIVVLSAEAFDSSGDIINMLYEDSSGNASLDLAGGGSITFDGVSMSNISQSSFLLVDGI